MNKSLHPTMPETLASSVVATSIPGRVYAEVKSFSQAVKLAQSMSELDPSRISPVPREDVPRILNMTPSRHTHQQWAHQQWARVGGRKKKKRSWYAGDTGLIVTIPDSRKTYLALLPRMQWDELNLAQCAAHHVPPNFAHCCTHQIPHQLTQHCAHHVLHHPAQCPCSMQPHSQHPHFVTPEQNKPAFARPTAPMAAGPAAPIAAVPAGPIAAGPAGPMATAPAAPMAAATPAPMAAATAGAIAAGPAGPMAAGPAAPMAAVPAAPMAAIPAAPVVPATFTKPSAENRQANGQAMTVPSHPAAKQDFKANLAAKQSSQNDEWDYWPDGNFERLMSAEQVSAAGRLMVHWSYTVLGGLPGDKTSPNWRDGLVTRRKCNGVIRCSNPTCTMIVRPQTRRSGINKQLRENCSCSSSLIEMPCGIVSRLYQFKEGVYYINGGQHQHPKPTHELHLSPKAKARFESILKDHPKAGPLSLLVGRPGLGGPQESVAELAPPLHNKDRIKAEKRKVMLNARGSDDFITQFAQFEQKYPGFVRASEFGELTVISFQTDFMASLLVKDEDLTRPVNGIVTDATHGFWKNKTNLLIISSVYYDALKCWVLGMITFANGGTTEHYTLHFLALMTSIEEQAVKQGIDITDDLFGNVRQNTIVFSNLGLF
jgi:hypothetical protein